jgi:predicted nucleic acid-binding protein
MVIDASVVLRAFFPDDKQAQAQALIRDHVSGHERLVAPTLLLYEVTNAILQGVHRSRITDGEGTAILVSFEGLDIQMEPVSWRQMLPLAQQLGRYAYDAAYLALAEARGDSLITGDLRLYNAVRDHLDWVQWIGEREE